jgi:hypothetical protein
VYHAAQKKKPNRRMQPITLQQAYTRVRGWYRNNKRRIYHSDANDFAKDRAPLLIETLPESLPDLEMRGVLNEVLAKYGILSWGKSESDEFLRMEQYAQAGLEASGGEFAESERRLLKKTGFGARLLGIGYDTVYHGHRSDAYGRWDLENELANRLAASNIPFSREVEFRGILADLLISTPRGRFLLIDTISPKAPMENEWLALLKNRARHFKQATRADHVFFAVPDLKSSRPDDNLFNEKDLISKITKEIEGESIGLSEEVLRSWLTGVSVKAGRDESSTVFAAMPFAPQYEDTFFLSMVPAAASVGAACVRVDQQKFQGDVVAEIYRLICNARAMIVDVSEPNPNVFFEAGYGRALGIPAIHISSSPTNELPFDVRNVKTIQYAKGQTYKLTNLLSDELRIILGW